ncbi:MAG TPA: YkgJ family cysteine cluster protein [Bryobacteraceae bacterium]|nr:YkgJ family cysteine cluster protein [Bryobacteraceae bacterium]
MIQDEVRLRSEVTIAAHGNWPCRKGCDDCCRRLASPPRVTEPEWQWIVAALDAPPADTAELVRQRIRDSAGMSRPIVCPALDTRSATCMVYAARPVACRTYGFYRERHDVLGCSRIESIAQESPDVVWGNHTAVEDRLRALGPADELRVWLGNSQRDRLISE